MANWCLNTVTFQAESAEIDKLQELFLNMQAQFMLKVAGQLPPFLKADTGYLFDIDMADNVLTYMTKWVPNADVICQIADHYDADFVMRYEECAMGIYGETAYTNGELTDICLEMEDFDQYSYDEGREVYLFEGDTFEDSDEILEILLTRRKLANL